MNEPSPIITNFERMLAAGKDGALLRYSLGNEYLKSADPARAVPHLQQAVIHDPGYTAAWKLLGRALADTGDATGALEAYRSGIAVAQRKGDKQAGREMEVFAKRLQKARDAPDSSTPL
ncbi:MAG: tetratricopeptide repeat protein [Casimicrobiaceae bacterium]